MTFDGVTSALTIDLDVYLHPSVLRGATRLRTRAVDAILLYASYSSLYVLYIGVNSQGYMQLTLEYLDSGIVYWLLSIDTRYTVSMSY